MKHLCSVPHTLLRKRGIVTILQWSGVFSQRDEKEQDTRAASQTPPSIQVNANTSSTTILLRSIPGVDSETQRKLQAEGILTTQQFLEHTSTKEERADLAHKVGLGTHALRVFVTHADLMRLQGVGGDVATLLEEAGVTGCIDLQQRNPEHLHTKLTEVQESKKVLASTPDLEQITQWIAEAMVVTGSPKEEAVVEGKNRASSSGTC